MGCGTEGKEDGVVYAKPCTSGFPVHLLSLGQPHLFKLFRRKHIFRVMAGTKEGFVFLFKGMCLIQFRTGRDSVAKISVLTSNVPSDVKIVQVHRLLHEYKFLFQDRA